MLFLLVIARVISKLCSIRKLTDPKNQRVRCERSWALCQCRSDAARRDLAPTPQCQVSDAARRAEWVTSLPQDKAVSTPASAPCALP